MGRTLRSALRQQGHFFGLPVAAKERTCRRKRMRRWDSSTRKAMSGDYRVVLSNSWKATTTVAQLTVLTRPRIVQPQGQTMAVGANVSLSVAATNRAAARPFRWRRGATLGPVTVKNTFTDTTNLFNIQTNQSGMWSVLVTNEAPMGITATNSLNAYITVVVPLTNQNVLMGRTATFCDSRGPAPVSYRWQRNGTNMPNSMTER